jgi:hypothetical protein
MPSTRKLAFIVLLACMPLACIVPVALAQAPQPAIQTQMTPEEFKAAGLDKLSAEELARLNAWLGRTLTTETAKAAADAKQKVEHESRGFFDFGSEEPIVAHISGAFHGYGKGKTYTLDNGQVWQQIDDAELPGIRLTDPEVRIKPAMVGNSWYMSVGKYNSRAQVKRIK